MATIEGITGRARDMVGFLADNNRLYNSTRDNLGEYDAASLITGLLHLARISGCNVDKIMREAAYKHDDMFRRELEVSLDMLAGWFRRAEKRMENMRANNTRKAR